MTVNEFIVATMDMQGTHPDYPRPRPRVICADGFSISIQANNYTYCHPQLNYLSSYTNVELGFPSQEEDLILEYAEDPENPTDTVYGYVPVYIVDKMLINHGGIDTAATFKAIV